LEQIKIAFPETLLDFNNASLEIYDAQYTSMKYHSDQALDLNPNSYIALFSCYEGGDVDTQQARKLRIQNKKTLIETELVLDHNSVVLFSVNTNKENLHKIIATTTPQDQHLPRWLGLTARLSKTFVNYDEETCQMHFENIDTDAAAGERTVLMLARTEEERAFFRRCKGQENRDANFVYPRIEFTLSESDLIAPV
jgi:hypothetical protein